MAGSIRILSSCLHFPFVQYPDATAAGLTPWRGRIRRWWGNPLLGGEKGKEENGRTSTKTGHPALFLAFRQSLEETVLDRRSIDDP